MTNTEFEIMRKAQKKEQNIAILRVLDSIKSEIGMYEADCRFAGGTAECEKCNDNVFGSIYRIIDKHIKEYEE